MNYLENCTAVANWAANNMPKILLGAGITASVGSTVAAVAVTPKAVDILEQHRIKKKTKGVEPKETAMSLLKVAGLYSTSAVLETVSIASLCKGNNLQEAKIAKQAQTIAGLGIMVDILYETQKSYRRHVAERIGEEREQDICEEVKKDMTEKTEQIYNQFQPYPGYRWPFKDSATGQIIWTNVEEIYKAVSDINSRLGWEDWVPHSDFLYDIDGDYKCGLSQDSGWAAGDKIEIYWGNGGMLNGFPVTVIEYDFRTSRTNY